LSIAERGGSHSAEVHAFLVLMADKIAGCAEDPLEALELEYITDTVTAYGAKR
jgi:hypothetical protein